MIKLVTGTGAVLKMVSTPAKPFERKIMKHRKTYLSIVLIVLTILLTTTGGLLSNAIVLPSAIKQVALPLLGVIILAAMGTTIWQFLLQKDAETSFSTRQGSITPSHLESFHKQIEADLKNQVGWPIHRPHAKFGALVVFTNESQIAQQVKVIPERELMRYPPKKRNLQEINNQLSKFLMPPMDNTMINQLPRPLPSDGGPLWLGRLKWESVKRYKVNNQYVCAAVFRALSPGNYLIWVDPIKSVSKPVFKGKVTSLNWR
jgi:hypothetical protein